MSGILIGLIALVILVVLHELGHALVAIRCGVVVEEFGIGLPPKIWKKKLKNGVVFSINWLMLGGFVKLQGEYDEASNKGDYGAASFWQKTAILFAGVATNAIFAVVIITTLSIFGLPKLVDGQFMVKSDATVVLQPVEMIEIVPGSAAEKAGLKPGDNITEFAGVKIETDDQLNKVIGLNKARQVSLVYERGGNAFTTDTMLGSDKKAGYLGVSMGQNEYIRSTWSAPIVGVATTAQFTFETIKGVGQLLSDLASNTLMKLSPDKKVRDTANEKLKSVGNSVAGPVGIVGTIFPAAEKAGFTQIALLTAIISISLAVMNILPIPMLDGGRWSTMVLFRLFKKKLTMKREEKIQTVGFAVMMLLAVLVTILDVKKIL